MSEQTRLRIIIVDDHDVVRAGTRALLSDHFDIIGEADNVDSAIELIKERLPQLVVLDVRLPGGGGTAVIDAVRDDERGIAAGLVIVMRLIGMTVSFSFLTTFGLRRSLTLRIEGLEGVEFTDFATQSRVLVESTTQVIGEMALIAAAVALAATLVSLALRDRSVEPS